MKKLVCTGVIYFTLTIACFSAYAVEKHNAQWWQKASADYKAGFMDAYFKLRPDRLPPHIKIAQIIEGLDKFYHQPKHKETDIEEALLKVMQEITARAKSATPTAKKAVSIKKQMPAQAAALPRLDLRPKPPSGTTCVEIINGDTMVVNYKGVKQRVRLLGVKSPNIYRSEYGRKAADYMFNTAKGRSIKLKFDKRTRDSQNNVLAYVYLEDGTLLNAELLKLGYARYDGKYPFKLEKKFQQYEKEAKLHKRGIWQKQP